MAQMPLERPDLGFRLVKVETHRAKSQSDRGRQQPSSQRRSRSKCVSHPGAEQIQNQQKIANSIQDRACDADRNKKIERSEKRRSAVDQIENGESQCPQSRPVFDLPQSPGK